MFGMTLLEQMGGETELRKVVSRFVDRMFDDVMIGFMFRRANREHIKAMEFQFAARHLGGSVQYSGRPLGEAHAPHAINGGQFNRRLKLLTDTLAEMNVPPLVRGHWIRNTEALRNQVLAKSGIECASVEQPTAPLDEADTDRGNAGATRGEGKGE
jgi:hemoglobin